jgi:hypothetical protein
MGIRIFRWLAPDKSLIQINSYPENPDTGFFELVLIVVMRTNNLFEIVQIGGCLPLNTTKPSLFSR